MKRIGKIVKNAVIGTVCTSILASSCSKYNMENNIYEGFAPNEKSGCSMVDLYDTNLSELFFKEAECIEQCIQELLNNPDSVQQLLNDPENFFLKREMAHSIELSEIQKLLLKAFADEDARFAINNNDVRGFVDICLKKGYINQRLYENISIEDLRKYFKTDADFDKFVKCYNLDTIDKQNCVVLLPVVAGGLAAVLLLVAAMNVVAVESTAIYHFAVLADEAVKWSGLNNNSSASRENSDYDPMVRLWTDNDLSQLDSTTYSELIEKQAMIALDEMKELVAEENRDKVLHIIRNQLIAYYSNNNMF